MLQRKERPKPTEIRVVLKWLEKLKRLVPTDWLQYQSVLEPHWRGQPRLSLFRLPHPAAFLERGQAPGATRCV